MGSVALELVCLCLRPRLPLPVFFFFFFFSALPFSQCTYESRCFCLELLKCFSRGKSCGECLSNSLADVGYCSKPGGLGIDTWFPTLVGLV